ncbi:hypothetical protein BDV95DRAFT_608143 [Massariosphaeria phaeospora]|uniref:Isoprenoid synthase domain-containing protein n=1 Tax=Massariosphaeria phaeospora TaxID=100035 RepID=A0A7C8I5Z6_9PLEO|nr:hypothetical protein BDV95DRAFT_608143 [Massariosphaeria phaeospora]
MAARTGLSILTSDQEQWRIRPINYVHDPLPRSLPMTLDITELPFPDAQPQIHNTRLICPYRVLTPIRAGLPYYSRIPHVLEYKNWHASINASKNFLELLAADLNVGDMTTRAGMRLRDLAVRELDQMLCEDRCMRAAAYMYPFCDAGRRLEIVAVLMVMECLFDGKTGQQLIVEFLKCLETGEPSPLRQLFRDMFAEMKSLDGRQGDGGAQIIAALNGPADDVNTTGAVQCLQEWLETRRNSYTDRVFAYVKFSIGSTVDLAQPDIKIFKEWAADHLTMTSDLYSYRKEKEAWYAEHDQSMMHGVEWLDLNAVTVMQSLLSWPRDEAALQSTVFQVMQSEQYLFEELHCLLAKPPVDAETRRYVRAVWACLAGHTFYCMTSESNGGPGARAVWT